MSIANTNSSDNLLEPFAKGLSQELVKVISIGMKLKPKSPIKRT